MKLDFDRVTAWMDAQGLPGGPITDVEHLSGGTQNVVVGFSRAGRRYVLRHPPLHKRPNSDEAIRREARVLAALECTNVPHPKLIAACPDVGVTGSAFYVAERVDGDNPTVDLPRRYRSDRRWRHRLGLAVTEAAAAIGAVDVDAVGLGDFGNPDGYLERQVARWRAQLDSYTATAGYAPSQIPGVDQVARWLDRNRPTTYQPGLVHGDYHLANILCARDHPAVAAVIDWELATLGDPLLDLGELLATWPDPDKPSRAAIGAPWSGLPGEVEMIGCYAANSNRDLSAIAWYKVLACYRLGIILEGTYVRSLAGQAARDVGMRLHGRTLGLFERALATMTTT